MRLQRDVLERGADVEQVHRVRLAVLRKDFVRDDHDEHRRIPAPGLVAFDQEIEERRPLGRIAAGVEEPPFLLVVRRGRPAGRLEERAHFRVAQRLAAHRPRRPAGDKQFFDRMVGFAVVEGVDHGSDP